MRLLSDEEKGDHLALLRQQTILAKFGELALKSDDLDEILTEACRLVGEALGTDLAKVVELQEDGHTLLVRAGVGWKPGVVGKVTIQAEDDTSEGMALKTGEPMISPDIGEGDAVQVSAVPDRERRQGGRQRDHHRRQGQAAVRHPSGRQSRAASVHRRGHGFPAQLRQSRRGGSGPPADHGGRAEGEERLRRSHEALEQRVVERTRDLVEANDKLRTEAAERERIEDALRQSHKMEAVGQLTGGLAHDFNNLLAGISGSLELIRMRVAQGRTTEIGRYVETALSSVSRAAALTHRLLAFSRRQTLDPKPIGVDGLVGSMADLFRRTVGPSIQIETRLAGELWPTLCDPNQLENALLNLVINARDAMPDGGHLVIETANVVLDDQRAAASACAAQKRARRRIRGFIRYRHRHGHVADDNGARL